MVIPNIGRSLRVGIPSALDFGDALAVIRSGALRDLSPDLASVRAFSRAVGINESTLRSAYLTEGRRPSVQTQARLDAALRANIERLLGRTVRERSVVDRGYGTNPLARLYLTPPPGTKRVRIVVRMDDVTAASFEGGKYAGGYYTVTSTSEERVVDTLLQRLPPQHVGDTIIWQYEEAPDLDEEF
jgi:hypothetical protein